MMQINDFEAFNHAIDTRIMANNIKASVFQFPWAWNSINGFFRNITYFFTNLRMAWQRAVNGYCERDVWNCGDQLIIYIIALLTDFRNNTNCWPDYMFESFEDWIAYIDNIIDLLEFSAMDSENLLEDFYTEEDAILEQRDARIKAFQMLSPIIRDLWW